MAPKSGKSLSISAHYIGSLMGSVEVSLAQRRQVAVIWQ